MKNDYGVKFISRVISLVIMMVFIGYTGVKTTLAVHPDDLKGKGAPAVKPKVSPILDPKDPKSALYLDTKGNLAGTGDPAKSGIPSDAGRIGAGWHPAAMSSLPIDIYGLVDWAKTVKDNLIAPRHSLDPADTEDMPPVDMNVLIESKSDYINDVIYPHYIHTWWLKCQNCHIGIFIPQKGANNMFMTEIVQGQWCGRCHGKVAFPLTNCARCHVSPKPKKAEK